MENQKVTIEAVKSLAEQLGALGKDANQTQLSAAIAGSTLIQIARPRTATKPT